LRELEARFDEFNTYNRIHDGFAELHQPSCEADSGPELLEELQHLFSLKNDVHIQEPVVQQRPAKGKAKQPVAQNLPKKSDFSYKHLKNNYLHAHKKQMSEDHSMTSLN